MASWPVQADTRSTLVEEREKRKERSHAREGRGARLRLHGCLGLTPRGWHAPRAAAGRRVELLNDLVACLHDHRQGIVKDGLRAALELGVLVQRARLDAIAEEEAGRGRQNGRLRRPRLALRPAVSCDQLSAAASYPYALRCEGV